MGKRLVNGSTLRRKLQAVIKAICCRESHATTRHSNLAQPLEKRTMLSASTGVVSVDWDGHVVQAYAGQYVAETRHLSLFQSLAVREGFTNVTSLGGVGFYSFDSTLPVATLAKLGSKDKLTFKSLTPTRSPSWPARFRMIRKSVTNGD